MHAKELTSDIVKIFDRAFGAFKKAQPGESEPTQAADATTESSIASPNAFVIDDRMLPGSGSSSHIRYLYDLHDSPQGSVDRWFCEVLLERLENLGSSEMQSPAKFLLLINLCFCLSPDGKRSSLDGLKVLEHIRFTESLPEYIRFAPAVLYSFEAPWKLLTQIQHPLLVQGAGVAFARLPEDLDSLSTAAGLIQWETVAGLVNATSMRRMLHPSMTLGGGDLYAHSYRNIVGGSKFCKEFAGDIISKEHEVFTRFMQRTREDLHLKRLLVLQSDLKHGEPPTPGERAEFVKACKNINFLVIDDEHAEGWSLGLYSGITGSVLNAEEYARICAASEGTTSDGRMGVRTRFDDLQFVDELAAGFQCKLNEWSTAFQNQTAAEVEFQTAAITYKKAQNFLQKTEADLSSAQQILGLYRAPNPALSNSWLYRLEGCEWSSEFPLLKEAVRAAAAAAKALDAAKQGLLGTTALLENALRTLDTLSNEIDELISGIKQLWQPNSVRVTEAFRESTAGDKISQRLLSEENAIFFEQLSNAIQQHQIIDQKWNDQFTASEDLKRKRTEVQASVERTDLEWETARQRCEELLLASIEAIKQSLALAKESKATAAQAHQDAGVNQNRAKIICADKETRLRNCFRFNLIFLDLRIDPLRDSTRTVREATGMRVLDRLRDRIPMLPVIMMTASDRTETLREAYSKGAEYWVKGIGTGDEMRTMVLRAAQRAALLPLWIEIQKVRVRSYLKGWTYVRTGHSDNLGHFETIRIAAGERATREKISCLLEDAFRTIWEYSGISFVSASEKSHYFNPAITNLGIVQELRIRNMTDTLGNNRNWGDLKLLARNKRDPWSVKEWEFHDLRNSVSHAQAKVATRSDAMEYLEYTVTELLRY